MFFCLFFIVVVEVVVVGNGEEEEKKAIAPRKKVKSIFFTHLRFVLSSSLSINLRTCLALLPNTKSRASMTLDLPEPLGPTTDENDCFCCCLIVEREKREREKMSRERGALASSSNNNELVENASLLTAFSCSFFARTVTDVLCLQLREVMHRRK